MIRRFRFPTLLALVVGLIALGIVSSGSAASAAGSARTDVIIGFNGQPGAAEQALVRRAGGTIKYTYHLVPAIAASVPEAAIAGLEANPNVTSVDLDGKVHAIDAELDNSWGVKRIGAGTVHAGGNKGAGVKVAVIDSGVDYTHPDLNDNFDLTGTDRCTGGLGYDFVNNDANPMDDNGHGTHVAGTVAAEDNDAGVVGVAPEACLYALKVLGSNGSGSYSNVIAALQWAVDHGVQVTNNSYGSSGNPGDTVKAAFDNAAAAGIYHAAAAGNSGKCSGSGDNVIYPARWDSLVAVAATGSNDVRACFSSTGPAVELAAPGVSINSTLPGGGYGAKSGTSMASPHMAGSAALVFAANPGWSNDQVRNHLQATAEDLGDPGRDPKYGYGLVRPDQAVASLAPPVTGAIAGTVTDSSNGLAISGATVSTDTGQSATTDASGNYTISGVPTGSRTVTASASGYASASQVVSVTDGGTATSNFSLTPATTGTTASVSSITYATSGGKNNDRHLKITIALVDNLGNPVAGASVSILLAHDSGSSWTGTGTTGTDGKVTFTLNNAPAGCYTTTVTAVSAPPLTWDSVTPSNGFCK
ncbi:MAG: S8 family serine peptidase [Dehalococcoidia bacterium]|nr:S8 family serine peptidase [Dehalococcoidia bacterium]